MFKIIFNEKLNFSRSEERLSANCAQEVDSYFESLGLLTSQANWLIYFGILRWSL